MSHPLSDAPQNPDDAARTGADGQEPIDLRGQDDAAGSRTDSGTRADTDADTTTERRSAETTARERTSETTQLDGEELEAEEERRGERSDADADTDTDTDTDADSDAAVASGEDSEDARAPGTRRASDALDDDDDDDDDDDGDGAEDEAEKQRRAEEFAREHDPADHDVTAGEQFRQRGDVVADDGRMKVVDGEGRYQDAGDAEDIVEGVGAQVGGDGDESGSGGGDDRSASGHDEAEQSASDQDSDGQAGAFAGEEQAPVSPHGEPGASDSSQSDSSQSDLSASEAAEKDGRRVSSYEEVQDGGYGVGSAATVEDRAMPLDHPVKAWQDTMTYVAPGHGRYEDAEPHVWFYDTDAAERAGFRSAGD